MSNSGRVSGNIKRGDILECEFGMYTKIQLEGGGEQIDRTAFNTRIPNEMHKTRPVVIIGDHKGQYIVVPISTTEETHSNPRKTGAAKGLHIPLDGTEIPATHFYKANTPMWAKANMVQAVDSYRLKNVFDKKTNRHVSAAVSREKLTQIQHAVVKAIGLTQLLQEVNR